MIKKLPKNVKACDKLIDKYMTEIGEYQIEIYIAEVLIDELNKKIDRRKNNIAILEEHLCNIEPPRESHAGCFSYPDCDLAPNGCVVLNGFDAEPYGHRG